MMRRQFVFNLSNVCCGAVAWLALAAVSAAWADDGSIDFNRDIRPLLSDRCYQCHGPDENQRQAELRFDLHEGALAELDSGGKAIVPGDKGASLMFERISSDDADLRMPPADSGKELSKNEIELLGRWIDEGAEWAGHWAFIPPVRPPLPEVADSQTVRNPIDNFARARLARVGLSPAPEAAKLTLLRRVTFDLTGLPPTIDEINSFLADDAPDAYEKVVDRLLASPQFGEHQSRYWLDAARYGDTHGLHLDNERSLWPYRDWVIDAFNTNKPFDEFTVEQLAGDLLPDRTLDQLIATGFNRCNVTTSEGGSIAEEYRVRYAVDRVETTSTVWMGLTMGCAVCHEHKFDPFSQKDFYRLFGYFANTQDAPMDGNALLPPPIAKVPTEQQVAQKEQYNADIARIEAKIKTELAALDYVDPQANSEEPPQIAWEEIVWIDDDTPAGAQLQGNSPWMFVSAPDHPVFSGEKSSTRTAEGLSQHFFTGADPKLKIEEGDKLFAYVYLDPENPPKEIMLQFNDGSWDHRAIWGENLIDWGKEGSASRYSMGALPETGKWIRLEVEAEQVGLSAGAELNGWAFTQFGGAVYWDKAGIARPSKRFESLLAWEQFERDKKKSALPGDVAELVKKKTEERSEGEQQRLRDYFLEHVYAESRSAFDPLHKELEQARKQLKQLEDSIPATMVMGEKENDRQPIYLLVRGDYEKPDKSAELQPGVLGNLASLPEGAPNNRLGLAKWLVDSSHPLTARVTVNRYWQHYFGVGIVKTAEDFGSQGEWPSHPQLLDWLAVEFRESGWNVKHMHRLIVTSATYRQSSQITPEGFEKDRENRLLWRGPRFRFEAEMIRDNALAISGLLVERFGGKSVKPYQPSGLWEAVGYTDSNTAKFKQDNGEDLFRRSLYTFWKRTSPPPSMSTFDAPSREACTVRRPRTNTPLQALVLMNDVQFVEAARHFAERIMRSGGAAPEERIEYAFKVATSRSPEADELAVLLSAYKSHFEEYQANKQAAAELVAVGDSPRDESLDVAELAAWTMVANLILNLNETVTKG